MIKVDLLLLYMYNQDKKRDYQGPLYAPHPSLLQKRQQRLPRLPQDQTEADQQTAEEDWQKS